MGILYLSIGTSFLILLIVNIVWLGVNFFFVIVSGLDTILTGNTLVENIYFSTYLKWILTADVIWIIAGSVFALRRKHYMTDPNFHYLSYRPIENPLVCVIIPAYNESESIEKVVKDYLGQKFVKNIIVVDNHSSDDTAIIAEKSGAKVIRKESNTGFGHSTLIGLEAALKTDANIIATTEADGTFNGYDIAKMIPYMDNSDMVIGTRQFQVLTEKGNQNSTMHVWGNFLLAKLIQIKYFSLLHAGVINLTDVGCLNRMIRREALEKIIDKCAKPSSNKPLVNDEFALLLTMTGVENNLKIVEVPVTFNKRIGLSKTGSSQRRKGIKFGLKFLWFILTR